MKLLKKSMAALAVIFAASLLVTACSDNKDEESKPSALTPPAVYLPEEYASKDVTGRYVYRASSTSYADTEAIFLFSDKAYLITVSETDGTKTSPLPSQKGTYTLEGDATDGKVTFTATHNYYDEWKDATKETVYDLETRETKEITVDVEPVECTITNGVLNWYGTSFKKE